MEKIYTVHTFPFFENEIRTCTIEVFHTPLDVR